MCVREKETMGLEACDGDGGVERRKGEKSHRTFWDPLAFQVATSLASYITYLPTSRYLEVAATSPSFPFGPPGLCIASFL